MRKGRNRVRVAGRRPPAEDGMRAVYQQVLRSFAATGHAPPAADLAETAARYGTTADAVLAALHAGDYLQLGPDGQIRAAYPFSGVPTPHLVDIDGGPRAYAMCAIDALGMAAMLGTGVTITSADPGTGTVVTVTVRADGKTVWQPPTAVVFNGRLISGEACRPGPAAEACGPGPVGLRARVRRRVLRVHELLRHPRERGGLGRGAPGDHRRDPGAGRRAAAGRGHLLQTAERGERWT